MTAAASRDGRVALLLGCLVFAWLALFHRGQFEGTDELGVYETTRAIAERASLAVPEFRHTFRGRGGEHYSMYPVGQSVLAVPLHEIGRRVGDWLPPAWEWRLAGPSLWYAGRPFAGSVAAFFVGFYSPLVLGVLVGLFYRFERELGASVASSILAGIALGACTHLATLSTFFLRHGSEALLVLASFRAFHGYARTGETRHLALGSLWISLTLLVRIPAAIAGLPLAAYVGHALFARRAALRAGEAASVGLALVGPLLLVLASYAAVEFVKWGSLFESPRNQLVDFDTPLSVSVPGFLWSPGCSVFVFTPLLALVPFMLPGFWRRRPVEALALLGVAAAYGLLFSRYEGWHGLYSAPGPRYLAATIPVLLLPLGPWLDAARGRLTRLAPAALLAALGLYLQLALMSSHWGGIMVENEYKDYQPEWGFLFDWQAAPPAAALRVFHRGDWHTWIVRLARGLPRDPPQPLAAGVLFGVWLLGSAALVRALVRAGREPDAAPARE